MSSVAGAKGVVRSPLEPLGQVKVNGELWRAKAEEGELLKDEPIEVVSIEGLTLIVKRQIEPIGTP